MNNKAKHPLQFALEYLESAPKLQSYSGRGMFGRKCLGLVVSSMAEMNRIIFDLGYSVGVELGENDENGFVEKVSVAVQNMQSDNMGMDFIYYFPTVEFVENERFSEDDDMNFENEER
jgi:hypothetical protein